MKTIGFAMMVVVLGGACAVDSSAVKSNNSNQPFPNKLVMLNVTMPDGTANELAVADGDLATVKVADHMYAVVPKITDSTATKISVTVKEINGAQKGWANVDQFDLNATDAARKPKGTEFAVRVEGIQQQ
jgi:hypothetical protein